MANFQGYLLKGLESNTVFPHNYIVFSSWSSTPNQREEVKAYRDDNTRNLVRITASGKKSIFSFDTRANIHLADKKAIHNWFYANETDHIARKMHLQFWDDENNVYKSGYFYRPNIPFPIVRITGDDIIYGSMHIDFIEY